MKNLIESAFQPILDIASAKISHYEALTRIRLDPTNTGHGKLIQLAEKHHFIHEIDLAILDIAVRRAMAHNLSVAVNLSPLTIELCSDEILETIEGYGGFGRNIILEITESLPIRNRKKLHYFINAVKGMGCKIAFDDYGNGFGHFTEEMVKEFKPNFLKLDGVILSRADLKQDFRGIEHACELAYSIGAEIIAEYVDSVAKLQILQHFNIRYAQGFLVGRAARSSFEMVDTSFLNELNNTSLSVAAAL